MIYHLLNIALLLSLIYSLNANAANSSPAEPIQFKHSSQAKWSQIERQSVVDFAARLPPSLWPAKQNTIYIYKVKSDNKSSFHAGTAHAIRRTHATDPRTILLRELLIHYTQQHPKLLQKWADVGDWKKTWLPTRYLPSNRDPRAYAGKNGLRNPTEDFLSIAQEYFLPSDSPAEQSIKCRVSGKYTFIKNLFPDYASPLASDTIRCKTLEYGLLDDLKFFDTESGEPIDLGPITMETVTGFELLYATPGTADAAEIAGHLLLRIKLDNNPQAQRLHSENTHDLVISFLADTGESAPDTERHVEKPIQCKNHWLDTQIENPRWLDSTVQPLKGLSG